MATWKKYNKKTIYLLLTLILSGFLSVFFQPLVNEKALDTLVNIYSILAGFLIGVIALIGDPASLPSGSWRIAEASTRNTFKNLKGTRNLLYIYLITLFIIFMYKLLSVNGIVEILASYELEIKIEQPLLTLKKWSELFILFCSFVAFGYSFRLPSKLFSIQQQRVNKEIESRRRDANIRE
ncbi:hypothetical protein [Oceanimonas smirnovii]|uniref:Uncharacterized protein n=1 Tax=Oceanimonas smirnovii TaxID=264574 RepID=A0ABW7P5L6_9GAMM